ncbi:MAG: hypothetical protein GTN65_04870, partial [Armatimonadetes bacterium]|nr:hypothetical protein [Armatimonadota bacterium]NIO96430.1 hypothetical protein [Armatimonadota bacterium]
MRRITRNALLILAGMTVIVTWSFGWREGLSVLVGGVLAGVNFVWMLRGADAVLAGMKAKPDAADAGRFLL